MPMRTITLEEHFVTRDFLKATVSDSADTPEYMQRLQAQLLDLGEGRIRAMDEGGVDLQILSLAAIGVDSLSPADQTSVLRGVHDELASAIQAYPDRLKVFCTPALKEPANAVRELERTVKIPGFVGMMIDGTIDGKFLDAPEFFPILEAAESLDVPVYIHPAPPPEPVKTAYYSGLLATPAIFFQSPAGAGTRKPPSTSSGSFSPAFSTNCQSCKSSSATWAKVSHMRLHAPMAY